MSHRRQMLVALALGIIGVLGLAVVAATGQGGAAAQAQYEAQLKKVDKNKADDLYALAKWCYQNGLPTEAMTHALEANQKAPDDMRPKYLLFALSSASGAEVVTNPENRERPDKAPSITPAEVDQIFKDEGDKPMSNFKGVQGILMARCGTPKCHGGQNDASKWFLLKGSDRAGLAENFRTISRYLNRETPNESRLLQMPLKGPEAGHPTQALRGATDPVTKTVAAWIDSLLTDAEKVFKRPSGPPPPAAKP